ncbi:hypothetical protein [Devosia nitrariae]|uniref:Uncharacterized protein n=1 Tax=Devosia nitrariae TaxID=2071872 RepID=A0ABQ5WAS7_9HYPH|nr:hypothetical protein [Devosia nitrariae]GLQ56843.1 hypothetical protein GCM10010862_41020 [Devosia nitrariae]
MKASIITVAGILALSAALALPAAAAIHKFGEVPAGSHQFVHPLDETGFNPQPEPPVNLQLETREHVAIGLLLPAVQKVRCSC